jgi:FtsP/CotA-like multicopper oxidase with cupredoxin domain
MNREFFSGIFVMALTLAVIGVSSGSWASDTVAQTPLDPTTLPQFVEELPNFAAAGRVDGTKDYTVTMQEFQQKVLPNAFYTGLPAPYNTGTMVFGYGIKRGKNLYPPSSSGLPGLYPGFTVVAQRGKQAKATYINNLIPQPSAPGTFFNPFGPSLQNYITWDQSIHWANPFNLAIDNPLRMNSYAGPQPAVVHLHGGEVPSAFDGGPDQWWTPGAEGSFKKKPKDGFRGGGYVDNKYKYPNTQEPATLWFHDHTLGGTRLNVYAGLAAFYFLRGNGDDGVAGAGKLPAGLQEVEIAIQDRQFDTNGQLLFPDGTPLGNPTGILGPPPNPEIHPFWIPEFFGDVIVVNGKSWPKFTVDPRRYRLRLLEGSNARFYNLTLIDDANPGVPLPFYVIGNDGGLLDNPVPVTRLLYAPGERYDVIVDFTGLHGHTITVHNDANGPYPDGDVPTPNLQTNILQFVVNSTPVADTSYDPSTGAPLRGAGSTVAPGLEKIVRLPGTAGGPALSSPIVDGTNIQNYRQLTLIEVEGPGGPEAVLVNNSMYDGLRAGGMTPIPGSVNVGNFGNWMTELPQVGSTEVWDIINLTVDAHPIHLHLVQFQTISRTPFDVPNYLLDYEAAFPGGVIIPGYGPPSNYNTPSTPDGAIGGNPPVSGRLLPVVPLPDGMAGPPRPEEIGWKDTVIMPPGHVTRIVVRWTPQDLPLANYSGQDKFGFDPTNSDPKKKVKGYPGGPGYVWHCHIVDHEDNEMMRPYIPSNSAGNAYP